MKFECRRLASGRRIDMPSRFTIFMRSDLAPALCVEAMRKGIWHCDSRSFFRPRLHSKIVGRIAGQRPQEFITVTAVSSSDWYRLHDEIPRFVLTRSTSRLAFQRRAVPRHVFFPSVRQPLGIIASAPRRYSES